MSVTNPAAKIQSPDALQTGVMYPYEKGFLLIEEKDSSCLFHVYGSNGKKLEKTATIKLLGRHAAQVQPSPTDAMNREVLRSILAKNIYVPTGNQPLPSDKTTIKKALLPQYAADAVQSALIEQSLMADTTLANNMKMPVPSRKIVSDVTVDDDADHEHDTSRSSVLNLSKKKIAFTGAATVGLAAALWPASRSQAMAREEGEEAVVENKSGFRSALGFVSSAAGLVVALVLADRLTHHLNRGRGQ